ncbi:MAG: hypothetical protein D6692_09805, partial [Planctomycetota bacterium]
MNLAAAKARIAELTERNEALSAEVVALKDHNDSLAAHNESLTDRIERLEIKIEKLARQLFGRRSETINPAELLEGIGEFLTQEELDLFGELKKEERENEEEEERVEGYTRKKASKKLSPEGLPVREQTIPVPSEECECAACGEEMPVIGHEEIVRYG